MFSNKSQLLKRTPENGVDRENYLSLLVEEYINTNSSEAKCQVLANLANFAYDPINYVHIRNVGVLDLFVHILKNEKCQKILHFATAGISNLCIDPENIKYILDQNILFFLKNLLQSDHIETVADTITIFFYLYNSDCKHTIDLPEIKLEMNNLKNSQNCIIVNLATLFLNEIENL